MHPERIVCEFCVELEDIVVVNILAHRELFQNPFLATGQALQGPPKFRII